MKNDLPLRLCCVSCDAQLMGSETKYYGVQIRLKLGSYLQNVIQ